MWGWQLIPNGLGGFNLIRGGSAFIGGILGVGAVVLVLGALISHFLDSIYKDYGGVICIVFIATSILYFIQQLIQKSNEATKLSYFLNFIVAPIFVIYLIAALLYMIPDQAEYDFGFIGNILLLLVIVGSPVIAYFGGTIITYIITIIARAIPIKFNSNSNA
ncbi:hypothetical protein ACQKNC_10590 [Lysinibacillus sp. NPDC094177]|uniref:hypothetical protein n=1 Tax=Lysinibacillus sp. NPDC094177 TaxID=3390580 RepID=UPI003CFDFE32